MKNRLLISILAISFSNVGFAEASQLPTIVVSKCTFVGSLVRVDLIDSRTQTNSEHFNNEMDMTQLPNSSKFFGEAVLGPSPVRLKVLGELLDGRFLLKVQAKDGNRVLVQETRRAPWVASERPKKYTARFKSPIVKEIEKLNPEMSSATWSARFPKNERVMNNLELSCLVSPELKSNSYWPW